MEDRLSELPDEILVLIISQLTLREAVLTSCLSSRWRYLWMHVTRLNFNGTKYMNICSLPSLRKKEGLLSWINHVLDLHKGFPLEEFSVYFPFHCLKCEIDKWLNFASSKKVKSFKLEFSRKYFYNFVSPNSGFDALKVLDLDWVNIDTQVVNSFLSNCPLLEQLSIKHSVLLEHLRFIGPSLKLKHLEICHCSQLNTLEMRNVNLMSFRFRGSKIKNLLLENVTSVHNIDIADGMCGSLSQLFPKINTTFTQLVMLTVDGWFPSLGCPYNYIDDTIPKFNNLKLLHLRFTMVLSRFVDKVAAFIELSPYLEKFTIEVERASEYSMRESVYRRRYTKRAHQHLKEVIYRGYLGSKGDLELTTYLFENTLALEKLVVDLGNQSPSVTKRCEVEQIARDNAQRQLERKVPEGVKLIVL